MASQVSQVNGAAPTAVRDDRPSAQRLAQDAWVSETRSACGRRAQALEQRWILRQQRAGE